jgi:hypothetical protein
MKYETPEVVAWTSALTAIQSKKEGSGHDTDSKEPPPAAYEDWED